MELTQSSQNDAPFDKFREFVRTHSKKGQTAQGDQAEYVPWQVLNQYWRRDGLIKEVLYTTSRSQHVFPIDVIAPRFLRIFSTIVYISTARCSYVRYLSKYIQYDRDDTSLPHSEKPVFLTNVSDHVEFFTAFDQAQWTFCYATLGPDIMHERHLSPRLILPITPMEENVSPAKIGRETTVRCVKVDPSAGLQLPESSKGCIMLKSFPPDAQAEYNNEITAYIAFRNGTVHCKNILKCLGCYRVASPSDADSFVYTIILEYANRGTLLDLYKKNSPPINFEETKLFWEGLCKVVLGLEVTHHTPSDGVPGTSCVHQDLKPSNIFVFDNEKGNTSGFNYLFKIGDFGLSHVRRSGPLVEDSLGFDSGGTRTYCPPELHLNHQVDYRWHPLMDMWCIGSVLIEAAVWVAFGERGRVAFQDRRRQENAVKNQTQRALGRGDCFHDGSDTLDTVRDVLDLIKRHGRKSDGLTPEIVSIVLDFVLIDIKDRYNARLLYSSLDKLIGNARDLSAYSDSHAGSTASSADHSRRGQFERAGTSLSSFPSPVQAANSNGSPSGHKSHFSLSDRVHTTQSMQNRIDRVRQSSSTANAIESFGQDPPWTPFAAPRRITEDSRDSFQALGSVMEDKFGSGHPPQGRPDTRHHQPIQQDGTLGSQMHLFKPPTTGSDSTIKPPAPVARVERPGDVRPAFPHLTFKDVNAQRKYNRSLPGEAQAMPILKKRDHLVLIDNSKTMQNFKSEILHDLENMMYILSQADPNGLDIILTSDPEKMEHNKSPEKLLRFVDNNFHQGAVGHCFIERSLALLTQRIIENLPSGPGEKKRFMSFNKSKGRPINVYVLTNGIWDPTVRDGARVCGADRPITQLIKELEKRNLHKSQVAIQFVRFGNDPVGIERLVYLDDGLGKLYPGFDIVDHKVNTGAVWPMLIGALDDGTDGEETT